MGWVDDLRGTVVGLDTAPLIYFIERRPDHIESLRRFFQAVDRGEIEVTTSYLTLTEVLVQPLRRGDLPLINRYRRILLRAANLRSLPVSEDIAEAAADPRARHNLRTPDAIQLATALQSRASFFLTNDFRLTRVNSIQVLVLDRLVRGI